VLRQLGGDGMSQTLRARSPQFVESDPTRIENPLGSRGLASAVGRHVSPPQRGDAGVRELIQSETPQERGEVALPPTPHRIVHPQDLDPNQAGGHQDDAADEPVDPADPVGGLLHRTPLVEIQRRRAEAE
jgi:hypothetical protein